MGKLDNPNAIAEKWLKGMSGAKQAYVEGVRGVQEAPGIAAANAAERMLERITEMVRSGRYQEAARAVGLSEWQTASVDKGADRLASGARSAKPKQDAFWAQFAPFLKNVRQNLPPRGSAEENDERMLANVRAIRGFHFNKR